jgi:hypothetical protein
MTLELKSLLDAVGVSGPFLVVAHSYGEIIARELGPLVNEEKRRRAMEQRCINSVI